MLRSIKSFVILWVVYFVGLSLAIGAIKLFSSGWPVAADLSDYESVLGVFLFLSAFGAFATMSQFTGVSAEDLNTVPSGTEGLGPAGMRINPNTNLPMVSPGLDIGNNMYGTGPDH